MRPPKYTSLPDKFWSNVTPVESGCWEWQGDRHDHGYGRFWNGKTKVYAHRLSAADFHGAIPEGMLALHHCDNTSCVNGEHLYIGTHKNNTQDMMRRGRGKYILPYIKGEDQPNAKLTNDIVRDARALRARTGVTYIELGRRYGVDPNTIRLAVSGKTWKHVK